MESFKTYEIVDGDNEASQSYYPGGPLFPAYLQIADSSSDNNVDAQLDHCYTATDADIDISKGEPVPMRPKLFGKARKIQQFAKLVKIMQPCNSVVVLNNLLGTAMQKYTVSKHSLGTKAEITIDSKHYEAIGQNKKIAKANVAEKVLRDICLNYSFVGSAATMNEEQVDIVELESYEALLMPHLASFAVHKLLAEWNVLGQSVSNMQPTVVSPDRFTDGMKCRTQLPPNPTSFSPTTLLVFMVPKVKFEDAGETDGITTHPNFIVRAKVGDQCFTGLGKSKKLARMTAAIDACKTLFGVDYKG